VNERRRRGTRRNWRTMRASAFKQEVFVKALDHPLRLRILEMHQRMRGRPLSVETLTTALRQTPEYEHVSAAEVRYHRNRLLDAELLWA